MFDYIPFPIFTHTTGMTHFQVPRENFTWTNKLELQKAVGIAIHEEKLC